MNKVVFRSDNKMAVVLRWSEMINHDKVVKESFFIKRHSFGAITFEGV